MITKFLVANETIVRQGPTPMWVRNLFRFNFIIHRVLVEVLFCNAVDPFIPIRCLFWANLATTFSLSVWKRNEGNPSFIFLNKAGLTEVKRKYPRVSKCTRYQIVLVLFIENVWLLQHFSLENGEWRWRQKFCST